MSAGESKIKLGEQYVDEAERESSIKEAIAQLVSRKPRTLIVFAEVEEGGGLLTIAIGSPVDIIGLYKAGSDQLRGMMNRSLHPSNLNG